MAGFTPDEINEQLEVIKKSLRQGAEEVRFPDGSSVRNPSIDKLLEAYKFWAALLDATAPTPTPSSFVVRTSKGTG